MVWLAVAKIARVGADGDTTPVEDILGVAAVRFGDDGRASIRCLAVRSDAPPSAAERLRDSCEASAGGRDARWLTLTIATAPGLSAEQYKSSGYRYYRRDVHGSDVLVKRLDQ